ncbi:F-box protein family [Quillaja saponaria]|uniref:F-box protein family n=1 Tax=Quillaja saponaria TaxID=32244 RepID=A0AAD7VLB7_QUISA|nr:F-box protein family [Quillaja saponaria]
MEETIFLGYSKKQNSASPSYGKSETEANEKWDGVLPQELIIEILLRLPVKSLVLFRCVSKTWLSLISNSQFGELHFQRDSAHTQRLLYISPSEVQSLDFNASFHDDSASVKLSFPFGWPSNAVEIMGSCNGFLCLEVGITGYFLWNPSTNVYKRLPDPRFPSLESENVFLYGFGCDTSTNDYLVVLVGYDTAAPIVKTHVEFYSLKTNSWEEIQEPSYQYMNSGDDTRAGVLLNGAIHWFAYRLDGPTVIVAFDLSEKKLREVPVHDGIESYEPYDYDLGVIGGCLSITYMNNKAEIWLMKEYNVKSSWTKFMSSDFDQDFTKSLYPICLTKGGELLAVIEGNKLVNCNQEGILLERRALSDDLHECKAIVYTESLLPLTGDYGNDSINEDKKD